MEFMNGPFNTMLKYLIPCSRICPCHYRVSCVVSDLQVEWTNASHVGLTCCVVSDHELVHDNFRSLSLLPNRCAHAVSDRFSLKFTQDQWSCAVQGSNAVILLQAFVFSTCLDVSLEGGGGLPTPDSRDENLDGR